MASEYEREILTYAQATTMKASIHTFNTIDELTADKAAVVMEKSFKIAQILQNRPVSEYHTSNGAESSK